MKKSTLIFTVLIFICFSASCYGSSARFKRKLEEINLDSTPASISAKANKKQIFTPSPYSEAEQNPFVNGMVDSYSNIMRGMTGCPYNVREQQKQQLDYAKQQIENFED